MYSYPSTINYVAAKVRKSKPEYGLRLVARRDELGLSLVDVERETNGVVYDQLLWRIENGKKKPGSLKMLQRNALAEVLKWETRELDDALGLRIPNIYTDEVHLETANIYNDARRRIPVYDLVSAGPGSDGGVVVAYVDIGPEFSGEHHAYRVSGESMRPEIEDSDIIIVRAQNYAAVRNDIVCWTSNDGMLCKRLSGSENGLYVLTSINPEYGAIVTKDIHIYGIVVEVRKRRKVYNGNH